MEVLATEAVALIVVVEVEEKAPLVQQDLQLEMEELE